MSSTPQTRASCHKYLRVTGVFLYLQLLLWSALLRPTVDIDVRWVPKSFFTSTKLTTCIVRLHRAPLAILEVSFFSALALLGYFRGCGGMSCNSREIYGRTLATFEQAMMGVRQKYYWLCLVPWIVTFAQNWFQNVGEFLILCSGRAVYAAHNIYGIVLLMLVYFVVQALLASEVVYMALHGWCAMNNINAENVEWEKRKRFFNDLTLNSVFTRTQ